ncbi:unnamed protein product [Ranitomeya imitator]|uniref:Uncharacterized protein n=1 Tax=Ranitomeya imitator TaxID=111125 RepID=A0ABN9M0Y6_9NEOB|nr:unnamed protein product [Ranitomeya imitator]
MLPTRLENMSQKFRERNYPQHLLDHEKSRALQPQSPIQRRANRDRVPFVHTFHPFMPKIESVIKKHWPLLTKAYPNITSFSVPALMCNRRAPNIKDRLVRADIGSSRTTTSQSVLTIRHHALLLHCTFSLVVSTEQTLISGTSRRLHGGSSTALQNAVDKPRWP